MWGRVSEHRAPEVVQHGEVEGDGSDETSLEHEGEYAVLAGAAGVLVAPARAQAVGVPRHDERLGRWFGHRAAVMEECAAHDRERKALDQIARVDPEGERLWEAPHLLGTQEEEAQVARAAKDGCHRKRKLQRRLSPLPVDDVADGLIRRGIVWVDDQAVA